MCQPPDETSSLRAFRLAKRAPQELPEALELSGHAVPGEPLACRNVFLRESLHEPEPRHLELLDAPGHDFKPFPLRCQFLRGWGRGRQAVVQERLRVIFWPSD